MRGVLVPHNRVFAPDECVAGAGAHVPPKFKWSFRNSIDLLPSFPVRLFLPKNRAAPNRAHRQIFLLASHKKLSSVFVNRVTLVMYVFDSFAPRVLNPHAFFAVAGKSHLFDCEGGKISFSVGL